jgi:hypothetical protein
VVAAVAVGLLGMNGFRPEPPVTFRAPEGWIDLSPGAAPADVQGLPDAVRAEVLSGKYAAVALEPVRPGERYTQTFNAIVSPSTLRGDGYGAALERSIVEGMRSRGATARPERREVQKVGGVDALRLELRVFVDDVGASARRVVWAIPAGSRTALLNYTCEESTCERLLPIMDASARATQGVAAPGLLATMGIRRDMQEAGAKILCGLAAIVLAVQGVARRHRRANSA